MSEMLATRKPIVVWSCLELKEPILQEIRGWGYCSDYVHPSTGNQTGTYDDEEDDAASCKSKCLAVLPESTSFYISSGSKCGCSATTTGACQVTSSGNSVSYEIATSPTGGAVWSYLQKFNYKA